MTGKAPKKPASQSQAHKRLRCPECGSAKLYKDGFRYLTDGTSIQRYLCRDCFYRFSEPAKRQNLKIRSGHNINRQVGGKEGLPKNLASKAVLALAEATGKTGSGHAGATTAPKIDNADVKGKIVEFMWKLKRDGYSEKTIESYTKFLKALINCKGNLMNPDSIKDIIAKQKTWANKTKALAIASYSKFAELNGIFWKPPKYNVNRKMPFLPTEAEIDMLIASCGRKMSTLLQVLKETAMRVGEALRLKWTDIDFQRNIIILNQTEKNGKPRIFKVSNKLLAMLQKLRRKHETVFGKRTLGSFEVDFYYQRKRAAEKLQNPRLMRITFHTLRHWKATMEYHKTKDILHVMQMLGHRNINSTLIYTQLVKFEKEDEFHSATAKTVEEAKKLIEAGFEYVCEIEGIKLFRKRK